MYLTCNKCGYEVDVPDYMKGYPCTQCLKGKMLPSVAPSSRTGSPEGAEMK